MSRSAAPRRSRAAVGPRAARAIHGAAAARTWPGLVSLAPIAIAALASCHKDPVIETRSITIHAPAACPVSDDAYAYLYASGDFEPTADAPANQGFALRSRGAELPGLPQAARVLVADVSSTTSEAVWRGVTYVAASGDVDLLVWPSAAACPLSGSVGARAGSSLVPIDASHVLVTAGQGDPVPGSVIVDFARGAVTSVGDDLLTPRARASATAFAGGAVVAGGADFSRGGALVDSAEVFVSASAGFDRAKIALSGPRADHGAVALANGEVLLVGGTSFEGLLGSLEAIDPASHRARTAGLTAVPPRKSPAVLRLASGEILVAGGLDADGKPLDDLFWLSRDATRVLHNDRLVASAERTFLALHAGGALAVVAPDDGSDALVAVISADRGLQLAATIPGKLAHPRLFDGDGGAPLLWTGDRWLRWQPWLGTFAATFDAPQKPKPGPDGPAGDALASLDPGLALWLDGDALVGLRFGARGAYTTDVGTLLAQGTGPFAPDRLVEATSAPLGFVDGQGLRLDADTAAFLSDATFADVAVDVDTDPGRSPLVVLRTPDGAEIEIGGATCPGVASRHLRVERRGPAVRVVVDGGASFACPVGPAGTERVAIGLRGASSGSVARDVVISRSP